MAVLDTFTRSVGAGGLGTSDSGDVWSIILGTAANASVDGDEAVFTSANHIAQSDDADIADTWAKISLRHATDPTLGVHQGGPLVRIASSSNFYWCALILGADIELKLFKRVSGSDTQLGTTQTIDTDTYAGELWWVKLEAVGSTIRCRAWEDGTSEPSSWNISVTDTAHTAADPVGFFVASGSSATMFVSDFESSPPDQPAVSANPGSYSVSGAAATLARSLFMDAQPTSYAVTGSDATFAKDRPLNAAPASYTVTGAPASLDAVLTPPEGVSIAFDDPLLDPDPTWTRIDNVVRVSRWEIRRGRDGELEKTGTGEATVFVNDTDGHFDPTNIASPWFGKLDGKQLAISRWNPISEEWAVRFRGYIEEIGHDLSPTQQKHEVAIKAVGFMDYLASAEMAPGQAGSLPPAGSEGNIFYEDAEVDDRILALLADAGFPTNLAVVFSGNVVVQESIYDPGYSFLAALQDAADAEFPGIANVYEDRLGRIVFHGRHARFAPDTVAADAGPEAWDFHRWKAGDEAETLLDPDTAQIRPPLHFDRSLKLVINAALAYPLGVDDNDIEAQLSTDATSMGKFGVRSWSAPDLRILQHKTNGNTALEETKLMADYYVANYSEPRTRPRQITLKALHPDDPRAEATWNLICGVDISDVVQLVVTQPAGNFFDDFFYVEGITEAGYPLGPHTPTGQEFAGVELTLDVSPTAYYGIDVFEDT